MRGKETVVTLDETLFVPDLRTNLLSVSRIADRGFSVNFRKNEATIADSKGKIHLVAKRVGDLFFVSEDEHDARVAFSKPIDSDDVISLELLHKRSGHANAKDLLSAVSQNVVRGVRLKPNSGNFECVTFLQGKMIRTPFPKKSNRNTEVLDMVHTDICGPMRTESLGKARYFIEFINDKSRWTEVRFLRYKSDALQATKDFITLMENQKGRTVKCLQSDNGGEYTGGEFDAYLKSKGITRRLTVPYNTEQNGVAERKNRTLLETARCLLLDARLPDSFWAEAVNTANYVRNRLPTKNLDDKTPFEVWTGKVPNISNFRVFGSKVYYLNREPDNRKFSPRGEEGIFLG